MTRNKQLQALVEGGIFVAMAVLLSLIKFYEAPSGGSVTPAAMLPLILYAVRWGVGPGLGVGFVFGTVKLLLGGHSITAVDLILDYSIAYMVVGFAGVCYRRPNGLMWGSLIGGILRFAVHFTDGIIFYYMYAPKDQPVWLFSFLDGGSYMLPNILILVGVSLMLSVPLRKYITGGDLAIRQA